MSRTPGTARATTWSDRLGLPDLTGNRLFLLANVIDSLGNGAMLAFQIVFFVLSTDLSAAQVGGAVTVARLISLPAPVLVGPLVDRLGARTVMMLGNGLSAIGFGCFVLADRVWSVLATGLLVQVGSAMFWTAQGELVAIAAAGTDRTRWFGLIRVLRNVGLGVGGALAALAVAVGGATGLTWLVLGNAVSFAVAAWLIGSWKRGAKPRPQPGAVPGAEAGGATAGATGGTTYREVLRDRRYLTLVVANLAFVLGSMVLSVLITLYLIDGLGQGAWLGGLLLTLNTVVVILTQTLVTKRVERIPPGRVLAVAAVLYLLAFLVYAAVAATPTWTVVVGLVVATLIFTVGEMLCSPGLAELSVALADEHARGRYLGLFQLSWGLGAALAPVLFTTLFEAGIVLPWLALALLMLLAVPLVLHLRTEPEHA